jgi:DNA repair protein RadC
MESELCRGTIMEEEKPVGKKHTLKDLPEHERPRERLLDYGAGALSNSELMAIILRTGGSGRTAVELAGELLAACGSLERLSGESVQKLAEMKGMGAAKACQIVAAFELGRRAATRKDGKKPIIRSPEDVVAVLGPELEDLKHEVFMVALLSIKNELMRVELVSQGILSGSLVHPRETFRKAILENCHSVILVHNHPSGDPEPSDEDIKVTRSFVDAGRLLGISVTDHIVIARSGHRSLKDMGVIS